MVVVLLIALFLFVVVVLVSWLLALSMPCRRFFKDTHGYTDGPCTRGMLHFGPHRRG